MSTATSANLRASRFVDTSHQEIPSTPIAGYQNFLLVSLMEALKDLANDKNDWKKYIGEAYAQCHFPSDHGLTREESAAIYLYTMQIKPCSFYGELNQTLQSGDRQRILPWFPYLKLFDSALSKLPDFEGAVWRGIKGKVNKSYKQDEIDTWWRITSCSQVMSVVDQFIQLPKNNDFMKALQHFIDATMNFKKLPNDSMKLVQDFTKKEQDSTLFMIRVRHGKSISVYSSFPDESEVILKMGTSLYIPSNPLEFLGALAVISLEEMTDKTPPYPAQWRKHGDTVAGGHSEGRRLHQLKKPNGIFVSNNQKTIYIADYENDRIVAWKHGASSGQIVAGGHGKGDGLNQLDGPRDVVIDPTTNNLLICDQNNRRIVVWPLSENAVGEVSVFDIACTRLTVDYLGRFYVSDSVKHEVRRFDKDGDLRGIVVAGGHGPGEGLNQLKYPTHLFVNAQLTLFISDSGNHRVMKWEKGASQGIVVAGGNGVGKQTTQLSSPQGVWADLVGNVYVADHFNHRVMFWEKGAHEGKPVVGENGCGDDSTHLSHPQGLYFDWKGNLYVADSWNHRIQCFSIQ